MTGRPAHAVAQLNRRFLTNYPLPAAKRVEAVPAADAVAMLDGQAADALAALFTWLAPDVAAELLRRMPRVLAGEVLKELSPNSALLLIGQLDDTERDELLALLDDALRRELRALMVYPDDSAGRLMETRIAVFRPEMTVTRALDRLRQSRLRGLHTVFLVDDENRLTGRVAIHDLAIAEPRTTLRALAEPVTVQIQAMAPRDEVVELLEKSRLPNIPVVDLDQRLVGVVRYATLVTALQETASDDVQTMVGASKDERALSKTSFALRKRQPWLQVNLLTAFLAAAVVGLFEDTIAQVTALAVLLPVVAGQSGNAGAQALAVTMRGLALREITLRHWRAVTLKEVSVGFLNGVAIAVTCGIGVFVWSGSLGLVAVIALSMVLAMIAAGFAGAVVPITLKRLGQDPAQSSSIILTTVTDVAGFLSFLGIATLMMGML